MRLNAPIRPTPAEHREASGKVSSSVPSLEIPSLGFSEDRRVLKVGEFAKRLACTEQHTLDLLEEGKLVGVDISGRYEYLNIPAAAVDALAARFKVPREIVLDTIHATKPARRMARAFWRIPVKEGFEAFLKENHSLGSR